MTTSKLRKRHNPLRGIPRRGISAGGAPVWQKCMAIGLFIALVSYFWWPSLALGELIVHADSAHHGLSLLTMLHQWLHQDLDSLLWSTGIYGGHPLFAEGQGGFLNPINLVSVALFEPVQAFGFLHWVNMLAAGLGVYALCRILDLDCWSSAFAAMAASFSAIWLVGQSNLTFSGTLVWMSWAMAAVQFWLKAPSITRASLVAVSLAFMIYAGYPQLAYGLALYFMCFIFAWLIKREGREYFFQNYRQLLVSGVFAVMVGFGLSAIQLLPLIELTQFSHRADGVALLELGYSAKDYVRGFFFFSWNEQGYPKLFGFASASLLALLAILLGLPHRIMGHLFGTILLLNLGMQGSSPLFTLIYEYGLIPGLNSFRIMSPFLCIACVGISVLAAHSISSLARGGPAHLANVFARMGVSRVGVILMSLFVLLSVSYYFYLPSISILNYVFALGFLGVISALLFFDKSSLIPPVLVLFLAVEIIILRNGIYNFYGPEVLKLPETIKAIRADSGFRDYNASGENSNDLFAFYGSNNPELDAAYRQYLANLSPFPALNWQIPSLNGVLALALHRRGILVEQLRLESTGKSTVPAGARIIDILGVRYLAFTTEVNIPGFHLMAKEPKTRIRIYRNEFAKPKLQAYTKAVRVDSPEEALGALQSASEATLFVEAPQIPIEGSVACANFADTVSLKSIVKSSQYYSVNVQSECPGWLFIRDAHYPGWHASLDGNPVELYPAQVLGKAVHFPAGMSTIEVRYSPTSFYIGALISLLTLSGLCLTIAWRHVRTFKSTSEKACIRGAGL